MPVPRVRPVNEAIMVVLKRSFKIQKISLGWRSTNFYSKSMQDLRSPITALIGSGQKSRSTKTSLTSATSTSLLGGTSCMGCIPTLGILRRHSDDHRQDELRQVKPADNHISTPRSYQNKDVDTQKISEYKICQLREKDKKAIDYWQL